MRIDPSVEVAIISGLVAIVTTLLGVRYKDKIIKNPKKESPIDRLEIVFDGYEKLIKKQQDDIEKKTINNDRMSKIVDRLQDELYRTREMLDIARADLEQAKEQNKLLIRQLEAMKIEYTGKIPVKLAS